MSDCRRHVATRREIIFVPVPVAGTVKNTRFVHPPAYRHGQREGWRPQRAIPANKAQRIVRWLDQVRRQEETVREFMKPDATLLKAWLGGVAVR